MPVMRYSLTGFSNKTTIHYISSELFIQTNIIRAVKKAFLATLLLIIGCRAGMAQQANFMEGKRLYRQGQPQQAIPYFRDVLATDSLNLPSYIFLSSAYLQNQQPTLAVTAAEDGLHYFPENLDLKWLKAESHFQQKQFLEARRNLKELLSRLDRDETFNLLHLNRSTITSRLTSTYQSQGANLLRQGRPDSAATYFKHALELQPDSLQSYVNLSYTYLQGENWDKARKIADRGLNKYPDDDRLIKLKSQALYQQEDIDELVKEYRKLYQKHPDDVETALTYGQLLSASGKAQEAGKLFDRLLKEHPRNPEIYQMLIRMNEQRMNYQGKLNVLYRMRKQFPREDTLMNDIAATYEKLGKWKQSRAAYDTLLTMTGDTLNVRPKVGDTYRMQDSLQQSAAIYRSLYNRYPGDRRVMLTLGDLDEELDQWEEALNVYQRLVRQDSTAYGLTHLGLAYQNTGDKKEATRHYELALQRKTDEPLPRLELSRMLQNSQPDRSFKLAVEALKTSLVKVRNVQQRIEKNMKQQKNLLRSGMDQDMGDQFHRYNDLAHQAFTHLTTQYDAERVFPVLQKLTGKYNQSGRLFYLVGTFYDKQGQAEAAMQRYRLAIQHNDRIREAHLALARHYEQQGAIIKAIRSYERALTLDPEQGRPYEKLITLYRRQGRLNALCDRWLARYRSTNDNPVLREHLIEALHKANRFDDAQDVVQ